MLLLGIPSRQKLLQCVITFIYRGVHDSIRYDVNWVTAQVETGQRSKQLTRMQNFLRFAVTGTERRIQLKVVHIIEKRRTDGKEYVLGGVKVKVEKKEEVNVYR